MSIVLNRLTKQFGDHLVVDRVSLEVADGELFVLLGGSGSGKSTILRLIAGLVPPDSGQVFLHGRDVTALPPQDRGTGFVFQNYSIFRHMSVAANVEFGLKIRKIPPAERAQRRDELLDLVGLAGLGSRYAHQVSGGQQQRVALARALAYEPSVLLLDEPFGALDVKIRGQLRRSLKDIQRRLGVTTILVTHDQEEAFELADLIGIIERGHLLEVGPPETLYSRPESLFAATFLGAGTVLVGRAADGRAHLGSFSVPIPADVPHEDGAPAQLLFRPEQVVLSPERPGEDVPVVGQGTIVEESFAGALRRVRLRLGRLRATRQIAPPVPFGEEGLLVDAILSADVPLPKEQLWVSLRGWHLLKQALPRLLVHDNGTGPTAALAVTAGLAGCMGASVAVVGIASDPDAAAAMRAALSQRARQAGLAQAELHLRYGNPAEQIVNEQAESLYELLVLNAEPHAADGRRQLSATLTTVLEHAGVPVLVVREQRTAFRRVLICTAAGEPGKSDVCAGGWLARCLGTAATLLYVTGGSKWPNPLARPHLERAAATLRGLDVDSTIRVRLASSPAAGILAEVHEGDYDLIVVGGHGPQSRSVLGRDDVTLQVLLGTNRPVLVVPAEEE